MEYRRALFALDSLYNAWRQNKATYSLEHLELLEPFLKEWVDSAPLDWVFRENFALWVYEMLDRKESE